MMKMIRHLGVQLGCNGIIQILIEPIDSENPLNPMELLKKINKKRQRVVLITLFDDESKNEKQHGTCMFFEKDGFISGEIG